MTLPATQPIAGAVQSVAIAGSVSVSAPDAPTAAPQTIRGALTQRAITGKLAGGGEGVTLGQVESAIAEALAGIGAGGGSNAEALGFVEGIGGGNATTNRAAWIALLQDGGVLRLPAGDWDLRFAAIDQKVSCPSLVILGEGKDSRLWVNGNSTYLDVAWANVLVRDVHFYSPNPLPLGSVASLDNMTQDTDYFIVEDCWLTNTMVVTTTASTNIANVNPYRVRNEFRVNRNHVLNPNGLMRFLAHRGSKLNQANDNFIDGGPGGGLLPGRGAITFGLVVNNGNALQPDDLGLSFEACGNTARRMRCDDDPDSAGAYVFQAQAPNVTIERNRMEKCYPFYRSFIAKATLTTNSVTLSNVTNIGRVQLGMKVNVGQGAQIAGIPSAATVTGIDVGAGTVTLSLAATYRVNNVAGTYNNVAITFRGGIDQDTLFTGDGASTHFSGTLTYFPIPDSIKIATGGTLVANDDDHGWAKADPANPTTTLGRQKIALVDGTVIGWVDYNSRQWDLTFPTPPAAGAVHVATYFEGFPVDNNEAIYVKSNNPRVLANTIEDCVGRQAVISIKGGGSLNYPLNGTYEGGPNAQFGGVVADNTARWRVRKGIFSVSRGIWCQSDGVTYSNNRFDGASDRIFRLNAVNGAVQISFDASNKIRNFYGDVVATVSNPTSNMRLAFDIDGLLYEGDGDVTLLDLHADEEVEHHNFVLERVELTNRITAGKNAIAIAIDNDETSYIDLSVERFRSRVPWRGVLKKGACNSGVIRFNSYRPANLVATNLVAGSTLSDDLVFETVASAAFLEDSTAQTDTIADAAHIVPLVVDTGGANTLVGTITSYSLVALAEGLVVNVKVSSNNSNPVTFDLNELGAHDVTADGSPLPAGALVAGQTYLMRYNGAQWEVIGLPETLSRSIVNNGGYRTRRDGSDITKRTWSSVDLIANATVVYALPVAHTSWVRVLGIAVRNNANAGWSDIIRDGSNRPTGIELKNYTAGFVTLHIETEGV